VALEQFPKKFQRCLAVPALRDESFQHFALVIDRPPVDETLKKKPELETSLSKARLEIYKEGLSAQSLHIGPYSDEAPLIARMHQRISEEGGRFEGEAERYKHHEIYLSDFRRSAPEKLKTVLRQPFANPGA
jgi:hypothetical protein